MAEPSTDISMMENGAVAPSQVEPRSPETPHRKRFILLGMLGIAALALIVGLSVGLTRDKGTTSPALASGNQNTANTETNGQGTGRDSSSSTPTSSPINVVTTITENLGQGTTTLDSSAMYRSSSGPLSVTLQLFSSNITRTYDSDDELKAHLTEAAKFAVVNAIKSNLQQQYYYGWMGGMGGETIEMAAAEGDDSSKEHNRPSAAGTTDFSTNNQETEVDESDVVKSDGDYVYAAYGDVLVVWSVLTGNMITNVTMPAIEVPDYMGHMSFEGDVVKAKNAKTSKSSFYWQPKAQIQSLLLNNGRLVVIVNGYGFSRRNELNETQPIFYDLLETRVQIYDTSNVASGTLLLLHETDINGYFRDARMIGNNVHLVTVASVDTYYALLDPISKWQDAFINLTDSEYETAAARLAEMKLIPNFVDRLVKGISITGKVDLAQVGLWQSKISNNTGVEQLIYGDGIISALTQVASFDLSGNDNFPLSLAGAFMSSSWGGYTYATDDMLVFAAQGWNWNPELDGTSETTYLLGLKLDGASATPQAVGSLDGHLLNQYSLDILDGYMRVATTIQSFWQNSAVEVNNTVDWVSPLVSTTKNYITILEIPTLSGNKTGELKVVGRTANLGKDGEVFTSVRFFDNIAYGVTFERTDPFYVLNLTNPTDPKAVGSLQITGFSSYLHSMNSDNTLLIAVGQEANETTGWAIGLQLTVFDASDPTTPRAVQRHTVETADNTYSSSTVEWDYKAFRYLGLGADFGLAILPLYISAEWGVTEGNFDGFVVFDVSGDGISERFRISHVNSEDFWSCFYNAYLPERSLVFDGAVMTLKGHSVLSTNLDSGVKGWQLDLDTADNTTTDCVYWR